MQNKLNTHQKNFLLEHFFKLEEYAGWKNIANSLITNGNCIVAGDRCIWLGGIGNFITTHVAEDVYGCLEYHFNLKEFLSSNWFNDVYKLYLDELDTQIKIREIEMHDLKLFKDEKEIIA